MSLDTTLDEVSNRCRILMESVPPSSSLTSQQESLRSQRSKNAHLSMMLQSLRSPPADMEESIPAAQRNHHSGSNQYTSNGYYPYTRNEPRPAGQPLAPNDYARDNHSQYRPRTISAPDLDARTYPRNNNYYGTRERSPARVEVQEDNIKPPVYAPSHQPSGAGTYLARAHSELRSTTTYAEGSDRRSRERRSSEPRQYSPQLEDFVVAPRTQPTALTSGYNRVSSYRNDLSYNNTIATASTNETTNNRNRHSLFLPILEQNGAFGNFGGGASQNEEQHRAEMQQQQHHSPSSTIQASMGHSFASSEVPAQHGGTNHSGPGIAPTRPMLDLLTTGHVDQINTSLTTAGGASLAPSNESHTESPKGPRVVKVMQGTLRDQQPSSPPAARSSSDVSRYIFHSQETHLPPSSPLPVPPARASYATQTEEERTPSRGRYQEASSLSEPRSELKETGTMTVNDSVAPPQKKVALISTSVGPDSNSSPMEALGPPIIRRPQHSSTGARVAPSAFGANYRHGANMNRVIPATEFRALLLSDWGPSLVTRSTSQPSRITSHPPPPRVQVFTDKDFPPPPTHQSGAAKVQNASKCC